MAVREFDNLAQLKACVGQEVAVSDWETITQDRIDKFADATGDHQWIHVDPARASQGPFGATIAHGFLTLSLLPMFMGRTIAIRDARMSVNYGLNKVRFTSPVPVGSEVRVRLRLLACDEVAGNGTQVVWEVTFERKGADRPVCVAESISRRYS
jgi:acyl dehydratase